MDGFDLQGPVDANGEAANYGAAGAKSRRSSSKTTKKDKKEAVK